MKYALIALVASASAITLRADPAAAAPPKKEGAKGTPGAELGIGPAGAKPAAAPAKAAAAEGMLPAWGERYPALPIPVVKAANTSMPSTQPAIAGPLGGANGDS